METIIETTVLANVGDYIIRALTKTGEEYVLTAAKFPKNYVLNSQTIEGVSPEDLELGFALYNVVPEIRDGIVVTREIMDILQRKFEDQSDICLGTFAPSQKDFFEFMKLFKTTSIMKSGYALARQVTKPEIVVTRTEKGHTPEFKFIADWGTEMVVALDDVLVMKETEVYRISRAEFNQTYSFVTYCGQKK